MLAMTGGAPLSASCRSMFPNGLPGQFSFLSTFRMSSKARRDNWNLLSVNDRRGDPQFGVRLNGIDKNVELFYKDYKDDIVSVVFDKRKMRRVSCDQEPVVVYM